MEREQIDSPLQAALEESPIFGDVPRQRMEEILLDYRCTRLQVGRGQVIYTPTAFTRSLGLLVSGAVQVNKGELIVNILKPGEIFGAAALFHDGEGYAVTLTARKDCDVIFFPQSLMEELTADCPAAARSYIVYLSERIRFLNQKMEGLMAGTAHKKLAQYLVGRAQRGGVKLECTATGLAKQLNISRASLYRAFDALEGEQVIRRSGGRVHVLDEERLRAAAQAQTLSSHIT